jgi:hypothetical protein
VDHRAANCPNNFPSPINYCTLTQADVDRTKRGRTKPMAAITTVAVPTSSVSDTSIDGSAPTPKFYQVAAVMGMSSNPVSYITNNTSNVIGDADSGSESDGDSVAGVSSPQNVLSTTPTAPLHVPHLYCHCLTGSGSQEFPVSFNALIDHGSSSVLIHNSHADFLGLRCKHLRIPFSAKLAMENNGQKVKILFSEYVKLQLHDPSTLWSSKSIHAIVAPGLLRPNDSWTPFSFA